jgi:hypothetical protein
VEHCRKKNGMMTEETKEARRLQEIVDLQQKTRLVSLKRNSLDKL